MENKRKSYILFGAGYYGEEALWYYGTANVVYFCDNKKFCLRETRRSDERNV